MLLSCALLLVCVSAARGGEREDEPDATSILRDGSFRPQFSLHGFADVSFVAEHSEDATDENRDEAYFAIGELDLYIVSHLADNISFFGELVFEAEDDGSYAADVERLIIRYTFSDSWWLSAGRHHTTFGYWNLAYHHGLLLQPTIERPQAWRFEDKGGILPTHSVGVTVGGRRFSGPWTFDYRVQLVNGRKADLEGVATQFDSNDQKAVAGRLSLTRERGEGVRLEFGPSIYLDTLPDDPTVVGRDSSIAERTLGFHFVYGSPDLEVIAEYADLKNDVKDGADFDHPSFYLVATWRRWKWKPYAGYDRMDLETGDPFFTGLVPTERKLIGVRWDLSPFNALKMEVRRDNRGDDSIDGFAVQSAFTF